MNIAIHAVLLWACGLLDDMGLLADISRDEGGMILVQMQERQRARHSLDSDS
jgi:hypothetical protein